MVQALPTGHSLLAASLVAAFALPLAGCGSLGAGLAGWQSSQMATLAARKKQAAKRGGHLPGELRLYTLPEATDAFFLAALHNAKRSIKLQVYLLTHQGVIDALIAAKNRGLDVQVMLEENPFNPGNPNVPLPTNKVSAKKLREGGLEPRWTDPAFKFTHAKSVTIDDVTTYVSSANFTKSGLGVGGKGAREYIIEDRSPSDVAEFVALFNADWARTSYTPTDPDLVVSPVSSRTRIFDLIKSAKREVVIQVEVAGDPALDDLIAAKVKAGVKVRALLADLGKLQNSKEVGGQPGSPEPFRSNKDVALAWKAAGAEVRWQTAPHLHAKAVQVDGGRFYTGSVNLTSNSMDNNRELGLIVEVPDLTTRMAATLGADWLNGEPVLGTPARRKGSAFDMVDIFPGMPI